MTRKISSKIETEYDGKGAPGTSSPGVFHSNCPKPTFESLNCEFVGQGGTANSLKLTRNSFLRNEFTLVPKLYECIVPAILVDISKRLQNTMVVVLSWPLGDRRMNLPMIFEPSYSKNLQVVDFVYICWLHMNFLLTTKIYAFFVCILQCSAPVRKFADEFPTKRQKNRMLIRLTVQYFSGLFGSCGLFPRLQQQVWWKQISEKKKFLLLSSENRLTKF